MAFPAVDITVEMRLMLMGIVRALILYDVDRLLIIFAQF